MYVTQLTYICRPEMASATHKRARPNIAATDAHSPPSWNPTTTRAVHVRTRTVSKHAHRLVHRALKMRAREPRIA
jgi:hypothetical protein